MAVTDRLKAAAAAGTAVPSPVFAAFTVLESLLLSAFPPAF